MNVLSDPGSIEPITQQRRKTRPDEKFILITQDCDIKASEDREPYVEALLCKHQKRKFLNKIGPNSARWFVEAPFNLQLTLLVTKGSLSQDEIKAINLAIEAVKDGLDPNIVSLKPDVHIVTEKGISMAEYYATRPLFLEYHTYKGEEIEGAEPYGRV
ncbi:MAG TPA: hypothetical protein VFA10_16535 [Ktedonobacteraceae bacterium]|nr:hypothetical protein [Ktedonobacteraceae bacterium]